MNIEHCWTRISMLDMEHNLWSTHLYCRTISVAHRTVIAGRACDLRVDCHGYHNQSSQAHKHNPTRKVNTISKKKLKQKSTQTYTHLLSKAHLFTYRHTHFISNSSTCKKVCDTFVSLKILQIDSRQIKLMTKNHTVPLFIFALLSSRINSVGQDQRAHVRALLWNCTVYKNIKLCWDMMDIKLWKFTNWTRLVHVHL